MELLIPGLILVALMAYASTRIKRSAAQAFAEETIETAELTVVKPEGFLHVLNGDPAYLFEAYTKEFGRADDRDVRAATARARVLRDISLEAAANDIKAAASKLLTETAEKIGEHSYRLLQTEETFKEVPHVVHYSLAARDGDVLSLDVAVLAPADEDMLRKAERMVSSFRVK